jgi:glycosyltransferase involved in cell wall biosynthesis
MKKIAIIGTVGLPSKYGGFETLTEYLTKYLGQSFDLTVYCSAKSYETQLATHNHAKLKYINLSANGIQSIPYDIISILRSIKKADTLLILGVSGCIVLPFIKLISKKNIIVNIDGLEWKREKWNKYAKWFLKFSEKIAVQYANIVISDNKVIQDYVQSKYGIRSKLIAYGGDHVNTITITSQISDKYPFLQRPYAFSVCRIEPENNIHMIAQAFAMQDDLPLVIIGNWKASQYGLELYEQYTTTNHIHFIDPIYDQNILNQIRSNCTVYVHGHSAGGTNPSLVEAMSLELPIIAYSVNYNKETTSNNALYFDDEFDLLTIIQNLNIDYLNMIKLKMSEVASNRYRWEFIAHEYSKLF